MCESPLSERSLLLRTHAATITETPIEAAAQRNDANETSCNKKNSLPVILFGQIIAFSLAGGNAASSTLQNQYQLHVPTCLTGVVYFLLSFHIIWLWRENSKQETKMQTCHNFPFTSLQMYIPWWIYLLLAILDVEANYLAMLSFQQTSLSSSMLLTSLSVLSAVLLRRLIFGSIISSKAKQLGVVMCILGGCLCLQDDVQHRNQNDANTDLSNDSTRINLRGDLLALVAAFLYGLNDVLCEYYVKNNDRVEYVGMLGLFGSIFSFCVQAPILEREGVRDLVTKFTRRRSDMDFINATNSPILFPLLCFVTLLSFFYVSVSLFLSKNDATTLNLSLQTCPLWAVVFTEILAQGEMNRFPSPMFFLALILVVAGTVLYESEADRNEFLNDDYSTEDCDSDNCCQVANDSNRFRIDEFIP
jgi:solute carrier family 35 protein F1/2